MGRSSWKCVSGLAVGLALVVFAVCAPAPAAAQTVNLNLAWDPNPATSISGYRVYSGTAAGSYSTNDWVPWPQATLAFPATPGTRYYFAVTAVDTAGRESARSNEVSGAVPTFAQPADQTSALNVAVTPLNMTVADPDGGVLQFSATGLPPGLTINTGTGRITGTPTSAASYLVTVTVYDGQVRVSRTFVWLVNGPLAAVSVTPSSGSGASATFAAQFSNTLGVTDFGAVHVRVTDPANGGAANTCQVRYDRPTGLLSLRDDAGNWPAGALPGAAATQQNSQCSLALAGSSVVVSGQTLTVNAALSFTPAYAGTRAVTLYAASIGGANTGWQQRGTWTVPSLTAAVNAVSVTPSSGTGASATFAAQFTDTLGVADLGAVHFRVADPANAAATGTCQVRYDRPTGLLSLRDDAGNWMTGATPGSSSTQSNSQCTLTVGTSSVAASGQTLTVSAALSFAPAYAGSKVVTLYGASIGGANTGWQQRGTWTVPAQTATLSAVSVTPSSGSGASATFAAQFTDTAGVADFGAVHVRIATAANAGATNTCQVRYDRPTGLLSLRDDAGNWQPGVAPGAAGTQTNSQCTLTFSTSSVTASGQALTVRAALSFKPAYAGAKLVYLYAASVGGANTGWQQRGAWTVP